AWQHRCRSDVRSKIIQAQGLSSLVIKSAKRIKNSVNAGFFFYVPLGVLNIQTLGLLIAKIAPN
ncbi:hypothetical protein, partial [Psychrobacter sp.]|uniref:hypothetical protein n=1 Tax=Psychrobacter sp. TaxID=56811 RepID=UPI003F9BF933